MGDFLSKLFVDVETLPHDGFGMVQVLFLAAVYMYILLIGANMIGDGSELLLLIPSIAGIVGSVVLPILGAVPDGAIVLFSGLGPKDEAERQISVGVGALAGSTVMLLTIPWFLSILGGRVPLVHGVPQYQKSDCPAPASCLAYGVGADSSIRKNAVVMVATGLLCYLLVELPSLAFMQESAAVAAEDIRPFAFAGAGLCAALFVAYIGLQYRWSQRPPGAGEQQATPASPSLSFTAFEQRQAKIMLRSVESGSMGLRGFLEQPSPRAAGALMGEDAQLEPERAWAMKIRMIVRPLFQKYDTDGNGKLSRRELWHLMDKIGESATPDEFDRLFRTCDSDGSGVIEFAEFHQWLTGLLKQPPRPRLGSRSSTSFSPLSATPGASQEAGSLATLEQSRDSQEEDDDEPDVPEDIAQQHLPPAQQRWLVLRRALWQMGAGTLLVLLFSDPMVDILDSLGHRTNISPFYVAFLLAPVASNASEMVASYKYAQKKSRKTISISFSQLLGAACMNNTFCLMIFYLLVAARGFAWRYHAEVAGIISAEVAVAFLGSRRTQTVLSACAVLGVLPLCLALVALLKATAFSGVEAS